MDKDQKISYKSFYTGIFSINYLFQGINTSMYAVIIPIYLLRLIGTISTAAIAFLASIILIPWILKVFFAIIGDRYGTKKLGRRKPYILVPMTFAGIMWIILSLPNLIEPHNALFIVTLVGILINFGVAIADTSLDGLIIDICPKDRLGRAQGFCWGMNSVGAIAGGPFFAYLFVSIKVLSIESIFVIVGVSMFLTSLLVLKIKEEEAIPKVKITIHLKNMFVNKKDWLAYFYSMNRAILDGVVILLISIYTLIKMGLIKAKGVTLSLESTDLSIYIYQANVSFIISIGIIIGALISGQIADLISRRASVYLSVLITTLSLILFLIEISIIPLLLFFASLTGAALGWRRSSASAILSEMSKQHPEMDATYFSVAMAFANIGASLGLAITGILLNITQDYLSTFLILAIISLIVIIPLLLMNPIDYEYKLKEKLDNN
jgi:PAT family beta-lactamase induction signal transducer AmpG